MTINRGLYRSTHPRFAALAATRPLARVTLSCGVATVLAIGAGGAATAAQQPHESKSASTAGSTAGGRSEKSPKAANGQKDDTTQTPSRSRADSAPAASPRPRSGAAAKPAGKPDKPAQPADKPAKPADKPAKPAKPASKAAHDPAGNNGTVKVDGAAYDTRVDNEPHVSCAFRVTFFGFDEGQTADITVTGIAPTGGGLLLQDKAVPTSDDAAGGAAPDPDGATRTYTIDDLGLGSVTPHPKQGYHVKVAVDSLEAPGGAKQKVLWLEPCEDDAVPPVTGNEPGTGPGTGPGTEPETEPETGGLVPTPGVGGETPGQSRPGTIGTPVAEAPPAFDAAFFEAPAVAAADLPASGVAVTSQASALPSALARTGAAGLALLGLLGAGAAAAGTALQVARRRLPAAE